MEEITGKNTLSAYVKTRNGVRLPGRKGEGRDSQLRFNVVPESRKPCLLILDIILFS